MNLSSKVTMYDLFAMIIPGFLLLMLFSICWDLPVIGCESNLSEGILLSVACYVIGLIYHKGVEYLFNGFRNNEKDIIKAFNDYYKDRDKPEIKDFTHEYLKAYYHLMKENMLNNIPVLEAQVAFIRNLLPLVILYIIAICNNCYNIYGIKPCCLAITLTFAEIILLILFLKIQNKIYDLVWEGNDYLKELSKEAE